MDIKIDRPKSLYVMIVSGSLVILYLVAIITLNQVYYMKSEKAEHYLEELYYLDYNTTSQVWWGVTTLITFIIFVLSVISYIDTTKKQYSYYVQKSNTIKSKEDAI